MRQLFKPVSVRTLSYVGVILLGLIAGGVAIYTSANGPWGSRDPTEYLAAARSLMHGLGYGFYLPNGQFHIYTIKPPLFSLVLAGIGLLKVDLIDAVRWLNILLFVATVFLVGLIFIRYSATPILAIPACLLMIAFPTLPKLFSSAFPEPLFLFLLIAGAFCLLGYFRNNGHRWLVPSVIFTSLVPMTRYIGISVIPVGAICLFLFLPASWRERLKKALVYGVLASVPFLIWESWVYFKVDRTFAGRSIQLSLKLMKDRFSTASWLILRYIVSWMPFGNYALKFRDRYLGALFFLFIAAVTALTLAAAHRLHKSIVQARTDGDIQIFGLFAFWSLLYILVFLADWMVNRDIDPVTNRLLVPVFVGLALGLIGALAYWQNAWFAGRLRWLRILPWFITLIGLFYYVPQTLNQIVLPDHQGMGETAYYWRNSETLAAVRRLPENALIASNDAPAILLWANRPAYVVLTGAHPILITQGTTSDAFNLDNSKALAAIQEQGVYVVWFSGSLNGASIDNTPETDLANLETVIPGLVPWGKYADGAIYYSSR